MWFEICIEYSDLIPQAYQMGGFIAKIVSRWVIGFGPEIKFVIRYGISGDYAIPFVILSSTFIL